MNLSSENWLDIHRRIENDIEFSKTKPATDFLQNQTIQDASKDPILSQITIRFENQKLDNLNKQSKSYD